MIGDDHILSRCGPSVLHGDGVGDVIVNLYLFVHGFLFDRQSRRAGNYSGNGVRRRNLGDLIARDTGLVLHIANRNGPDHDFQRGGRSLIQFTNVDGVLGGRTSVVLDLITVQLSTDQLHQAETQGIGDDHVRGLRSTFVLHSDGVGNSVAHYYSMVLGGLADAQLRLTLRRYIEGGCCLRRIISVRIDASCGSCVGNLTSLYISRSYCVRVGDRSVLTSGQITNLPTAALRKTNLTLHGVVYGHVGQIHVTSVGHLDGVFDRLVFLRLVGVAYRLAAYRGALFNRQRRLVVYNSHALEQGLSFGFALNFVNLAVIAVVIHLEGIDCIGFGKAVRSFSFFEGVGAAQRDALELHHAIIPRNSFLLLHSRGLTVCQREFRAGHSSPLGIGLLETNAGSIGGMGTQTSVVAQEYCHLAICQCGLRDVRSGIAAVSCL